MRLESFKARCIGSGSTLLHSQRSPSIDSNDDDARIRLDDPSLRLQIAESPSPSSDNPDFTFNDVCNNSSNKEQKRDSKVELDPNMNAHSVDARQYIQQV